MSGLLYKSDQGYWTRMMSAIGGGLIVLACATWAWDQLSVFSTERLGFERIFLQGGVAAAIGLLGGLVVFWFCYGSRKSSEFLIATEGEMKKVNWSSRREVLGSTRVVILIAFMLAAALFVVDFLFGAFFRSIGLLQA